MCDSTLGFSNTQQRKLLHSCCVVFNRETRKDKNTVIQYMCEELMGMRIIPLARVTHTHSCFFSLSPVNLQPPHVRQSKTAFSSTASTLYCNWSYYNANLMNFTHLSSCMESTIHPPLKSLCWMFHVIISAFVRVFAGESPGCFLFIHLRLSEAEVRPFVALFFSKAELLKCHWSVERQSTQSQVLVHVSEYPKPQISRQIIARSRLQQMYRCLLQCHRNWLAVKSSGSWEESKFIQNYKHQTDGNFRFTFQDVLIQ